MEIAFRDFINIIIEPDHSRAVLLGLQKKYNIDSLEFLKLYREGIPLPISDDDMDNWLYQLKIYAAAEGNISELIGSDYGANPLSAFRDNPFFSGQPSLRYDSDVQEEAESASSCHIGQATAISSTCRNSRQGVPVPQTSTLGLCLIRASCILRINNRRTCELFRS